jgi:hypothetical protein
LNALYDTASWAERAQNVEGTKHITIEVVAATQVGDEGLNVIASWQSTLDTVQDAGRLVEIESKHNTNVS